jgi:hypothetical protein
MAIADDRRLRADGALATRVVRTAVPGWDVVGDLHGCATEFLQLLEALGYERGQRFLHPEGRKIVLLGDQVDRGPASIPSLPICAELVRAGSALVGSLGNHDYRAWRHLLYGEQPQRWGGLRSTLAELAGWSARTPGLGIEFLTHVTRCSGARPSSASSTRAD